MNQPIYRDYDRSQLDAQYNLRAAFPDFSSHVQRWQQLSAESLRKYHWTLAIPYGSHPDMKLDICLPGRPSGSVHVFFHGGYWQAMGREYFSFIADDLAKIGVTSVIPSYPLAPAAAMREILAAANAAVSWTWHHAAEFGADRRRISLGGHSAGAHLATMVCEAAARNELTPLPTDAILSVVCLSGIYDLEPIRLSYLNEALHLDDSDCEFSPINRVAPGSAAAVLQLGEYETREFHRQQHSYYDRCLASGRRTAAIVIPKRHHFDILSHVYSGETAEFASIRAAAFGDTRYMT